MNAVLALSLAVMFAAPADTVGVLPAPVRSVDALEGSAFWDLVWDMDATSRQEVAVSELLSGNVPESLRHLVSVPFKAPSGDMATIWVTPDYLMVGSDRDAARVPLSMPSARRVAEAFGMLLPTPDMVDAIYAAADVHLRPQPMTPGEDMRSTAYYAEHDLIVRTQRASAPSGHLIAGHKKDVVVSDGLLHRTDRVAIYGWHRSTGRPIQPVYLGHVDHYEDYSHGVRLVHPMALVNDRLVSLDDLVDTPMTTLSHTPGHAH